MNQDFQFDTPTLITLTAPTASGKSFLLEKMMEHGMERIVSTTTRSPRKGEREGVDYYFITTEESKNLELAGKFAELVTFQGVQYGVTADEFHSKMMPGKTPVIIMTPEGIEQYSHLCKQFGWDTFCVYVHVVEKERVERLNKRTIQDLREGDIDDIEPLIRQHTKRIQGLMQAERHWSNTRIWDAIVPGDNVDKALDMIKQGVKNRNQRKKQIQTNLGK